MAFIPVLYYLFKYCIAASIDCTVYRLLSYKRLWFFAQFFKIIISLFYFYDCLLLLLSEINTQVELNDAKEKAVVPLLMQNCAPRVEGIESYEKLDIAMRPDGVSYALILHQCSIRLSIRRAM